MSTKQIKNLICLKRLLPYKPRKTRNFVFFLVHTFLDANTDCDFFLKTKYFPTWLTSAAGSGIIIAT